MGPSAWAITHGTMLLYSVVRMELLSFRVSEGKYFFCDREDRIKVLTIKFI